MSLAVQLITGLAMFAAGATAGMRWHAGQDALAEVARLNTQAESLRLASANKSRRDGAVIEAQNVQTKRSQILAAAAASARAESRGLRDDITAVRANLPSASADAGADHCTAERALLDVLGAGLESLASQGAGIAAAADGHASDSLMYQQGWPK